MKMDAPAEGVRRGYKILTHDLRPPIQGGDPLFQGALPVTLPAVRLDTGPDDCGPSGWHYCATLEEALAIAGYWPNGRPSRGFRLLASDDAVERRAKRRASALTLLAECSDAEMEAAIVTLSQRWFGPSAGGTDALAAEMAAEQVAWRRALARPRYDEAAVEAGLRAALEARGLGDWTLRRFNEARAAWDAWDAWDAWAARAAWDAWAARAARAAWDARAAWAAWDVRAAWAAWAARDAWAAWDVRAAWAARAALVAGYASRRGWVAAPPDRLTVGLRDAYVSGLAVAVPVADLVLGWSMVETGAAKETR